MNLSLSIWLRGERLPLDQPVMGLIPLLPLPKEKSVPAGIGIGLPPHKPHELMGPRLNRTVKRPGVNNNNLSLAHARLQGSVRHNSVHSVCIAWA